MQKNSIEALQRLQTSDLARMSARRLKPVHAPIARRSGFAMPIASCEQDLSIANLF